MLYSNIVLKTLLCGAIIIVCIISVQSFAQLASLELQEKCARQAQTAFNNMQFQDRKLASFRNHCNVKLNRCFIDTEQDMVPGGPDIFWTYKFVSDAYEGKDFGSYVWHSDKVKKYWDPPFQCQVTLPSGEEKLCKSSDEFDDLINVYMQ